METFGEVIPIREGEFCPGERVERLVHFHEYFQQEDSGLTKGFIMLCLGEVGVALFPLSLVESLYPNIEAFEKEMRWVISQEKKILIKASVADFTIPFTIICLIKDEESPIDETVVLIIEEFKIEGEIDKNEMEAWWQGFVRTLETPFLLKEIDS